MKKIYFTRSLKKALLIALAPCTAICATAALPQQAVAGGVPVPKASKCFETAASGRRATAVANGVMSFNSREHAPALPALQLQDARKHVAKADAQLAPGVFGYLYYFQGSKVSTGMYRINPDTGTEFMWTDYYTENSMTMTAGWIRNGRLCGINSIKFYGSIYAYGQIELDLATGRVLDFQQRRFDGNDYTNQFVTAAYRDLDDRIYGYGYSADGESFTFSSAPAYDIDLTEVVSDIASGQVCSSLCYDVQQDCFYGVNTSGQFVRVDITGKQTVLFNLNVDDFRSTVTGLAYSASLGKYIWNAYKTDGSSAMYAIDPTAKSATLLYDCPYGEEYIYMVTNEPNCLPDAPATPEINSIDFVGSALSGTAACTMPSTTADGSALSGNIDWRLLVDGTEVAAGVAAAGSNFNVNVPAVTEGSHTFALIVGDEATGCSLPALLSRWVGNDYPLAPADVVLSETSASWAPVSQGVHGGYVDTQAISYHVYLNGTKLTETAATTTAITLPADKPYTAYTVEVIAVANDHKSAPALSNAVTYGLPLEINPRIYYRPEESEFVLFKPFDLDGKTTSDGQLRCWQFSDVMGFPSFMSGADGEDMLICPPMYFDTAEKAYLFSFEAGLRLHTETTNTIEVWIGKEPTPEAMTRCILPPYEPRNMLADVVSEYFAVQEPGTYYLGILTKTDAVGIHISEITVSRTDRDAEVPCAVNDLNLIPADKGLLETTVEFTMPAKTASGADISANTEITATIVSREFVLNHPDQGEVTATLNVTGAPGSKQSVNIATIQNYNTIGVTCSIGGLSSAETTASVYTGVVKPYIVQNLTAQISEDNLSATLSWTPPVESDDIAGDGPIGTDFYYTVWYYNSGWTYLDAVGWNELSTVVSLEQGDPQNYYLLGIMALNGAGQSEHISAVTVVIGTPYELPMTENFENDEETYWPIMIQRPSAEYQGTDWTADDPALVSPIFANNSEFAYIGYIGQEGYTKAKSRLSMPKFSTRNVTDVTFSLTYWGGSYAASLSLLANCYGFETPLAVGDFPAGSGWVTNSLTLPAEVLDRDWCELLLDSNFPSTNTFAMFSAYAISGVSGVADAALDAEGTINTTPGMLHIAGFEGEQLIVSDIAGRTIISVDKLPAMSGYALAPGLYIVRAGATTAKVRIN